MKPTGTRASRAAASRSERSTDAESTTGSVLGIATTMQNPPAAAARVPVSRSSLCSCPGVRRCTCGSTNAGNRWRPCASTISVPAGRRDRPRRGELGDLAVAHEHVVDRVVAGARIEHARLADQQVGGSERHPDQRVDSRRAHAGCGSVAGSPTRAEASTS